MLTIKIAKLILNVCSVRETILLNTNMNSPDSGD